MVGAPAPADRRPGAGASLHREVADPTSLDQLVTAAVALGATDLHLTAGAVPRIRVGGEVLPLRDWSPLRAGLVEAVVERIAGLEVGDVPGHTELDCSWTFDDHRFRVNIYRSAGRLAVAMRAIPLHVPSLDSLGVPGAILGWPEHRRGLLLCCGPTGSGKTTTLAAVIREITTSRRCHVVTMEDPIEYLHESRCALVHQRAIGEDSPTFASALRAVLREDPDVILVGEMRDPETIRLALTAAETGHLVLSTVHASDAVGMVNRLVDVFPGDEQPQIRTMLAGTLLGASCQTLVQDAHLPRLRHLVAEVLVATPAVRAAIREGRTTALGHAVETGTSEGMQSFDRAYAEAVADGRIARAEAEALAPDRALFLRNLRELGRGR